MQIVKPVKVEAGSARDQSLGSARLGPLAALLLGLFAALVLLAGVQEQAQALASHPPNAVLKKGTKTLQTGRLITYCWGGMCSDGVSRYPAAVRTKAGSKLYIRLSEKRRPDSFSLSFRQSPNGPSRPLNTKLQRVERDGKTVAWKVFFHVNKPDRHYYLDAFGQWNSTGGRPYGDAFWQFHVKTRP